MTTALITGATSGIGREFARQMARAHINLALVARNRDRLQALADELATHYGISVRILSEDLATSEGRMAVCEHLTSADHGIDILVNNAGFGLGQDFVDGDIARENAGLDVMVRAVMELSHAGARAMRSRGHGAIINVASITSLTAQGTYSAHKAWVRTFTEGLAEELRGTGVSATVVCPGLTRTEFHERSGVDPQQWPGIAFTSASQVAADAIEGAKLGRVIVTPSLKYRVVAAVLRVTPRFIVRRIAGPGRSGRA